MTLHSYLLFVVASIGLALVPGPDMAYMLGRCIAQGRRAGMLAALGFNLGGYVHLTAAVLGLSAILATSALAFNVVKWLGAGYLVYLGVHAFLRAGTPLAVRSGGMTAGGAIIFWQAFLSDVLNPKVAVFFLAFLPQFVPSHAAHPLVQILLLGLTVNMVCLPVNLLVVGFSAKLTEALRESHVLSGWLQRGMGALFVALGVRLAVEKS